MTHFNSGSLSGKEEKKEGEELSGKITNRWRRESREWTESSLFTLTDRFWSCLSYQLKTFTMVVNEAEVAPKWRLHDDSTRNQFPIGGGLFCPWGFSHAVRVKVELRWDCFWRREEKGRKIEEIDGGGCLFVCLIHGEGGREGKKHWNINFLFAVFIIGTTTTTKQNDKRREEMNSGFFDWPGGRLAGKTPRSNHGGAHFLLS